MRQLIITFIFTLCAIASFAQDKCRELPFSMPPAPMVDLPCRGFVCKDRPDILNTIWQDFQLTIPEQAPQPNEDGEGGGWFEDSYICHFESGSPNYSLSLIALGAGDYGKYMLVIMSPDGKCLDALEVGVYHTTKYDSIYLKEFTIDKTRGINVHQLRPTSKTPIMAYDEVAFPIEAQRIDTHYYIKSQTGEFAMTSETIYDPQLYTKEQFVASDYKIWEGDERDGIAYITNCFFTTGDEKDKVPIS